MDNLDNFDKKLTEKEIKSKKKEDWLNFLRVRYDFPDNYDLIENSELKSLKTKKFFSGILTGLFILIAILILSGTILYLGNKDKFISNIVCGNQTCENTCPTCQVNTCPTNNCNLNCPNVNLTCPIVNVYTNNST